LPKVYSSFPLSPRRERARVRGDKKKLLAIAIILPGLVPKLLFGKANF
jgi:hypothetical protein